jgi:hypothetical protein
VFAALVAVAARPPEPVSASGATRTVVPQHASEAATGAPDYSDPSLWLCADTTGTLPVDVFYLYPTSYVRGSAASPTIGPIDDPGMIAGAKVAFMRQASAFKPAGNIYAPYYRQADAAARAAMPQAEQDQVVAGAPTQDGIAAFDYFIKHYNHGRPFILVGHSLGSNVMANLLSQYMGEHPDVNRRMVAAYVVGYSITPTYLAHNPFLNFATGANDTGVICSWNTEGPSLAGTNPVTLPGGIAINPISWTRSETTATAEENLGSILLNPENGGQPILNPDGTLKRYMNLIDAHVDVARGVVVCSSVPETEVASFVGGFPAGVYHPFDYPFYYFNVRWNAVNRAGRYVGISLPSVSPTRPTHGKAATFSAALTAAPGFSGGKTTLSFYRHVTRTVNERVRGVLKRVKVVSWQLDATRAMSLAAGGHLALTYKVPSSGTWKMVARYSGSMSYNAASSLEKTFGAR